MTTDLDLWSQTLLVLTNDGRKSAQADAVKMICTTSVR